MLFAMVVSAMAQGAQVDFSDPKYAPWGEAPESRQQNMLVSTFMKEAIDAKNYDVAAGHFQVLIANCPTASVTIYQRGLLIYKNKIARAKSLSEKKVMVDSLMLVHDLRITHFGDHAKQGRPYILDSKARDLFKYNKNDRDGLREVFHAAIEANGMEADSTLVLLYFQNLCEDYSMDLVMADRVIGEYDRLARHFEGEEHAESRAQFDSLFGASGVASCENLEAIFTKKLAATPDDERVLANAVKLMDRAGCKTPFYAQVAEKFYEVSPTSRAAMALATIFQNDGDFAKASKYLRDALAAETDQEEQELLNARIALIELASNNLSAALAAAKKSLATADGTVRDNGTALFVIAQCYGTSAASCADLPGQIAYLAAYDAMAKAIANFSADEESYRQPAKALLAQFKSYFPTKEECFFNEIEVGSMITVECGLAKGVSAEVRTRD